MARTAWAAVAVGLAAGCAGSGGSAGGDSPEVRQAVQVLRDAIKAGDIARLWALLDAKAQTDFDQAADAVKAKYRAADAAGKAELEKEHGLTGAELEALTGQGYLKSRRFAKKYAELPESQIGDVKVVGKQATVNYVEPDGDKETLKLALRDGVWKAVLAAPEK